MDDARSRVPSRESPFGEPGTVMRFADSTVDRRRPEGGWATASGSKIESKKRTVLEG